MEVTPTDSLIDEPLAVKVERRTPGESVTLRCSLGPWSSQAEFEVAADGTVDPSVQAPISGDYDGIHAMRLFWSMKLAVKPSSPPPPPPPSSTSDVIPPATYSLSAVVRGGVVGSVDVLRRWSAPGVTRHVVRERSLFGTLFTPPGDGPFPGVIQVSGSAGGVFEPGAALLASRGYAVFALAYFAFEELPPYVEEIPLEYFETARAWLAARDEVSEERIAIMGGSRGGELALLLGATNERFRAVVALVPSHVVWGSAGGPTRSLMDEPTKSGWMQSGEPVPFITGTISEAATAERLAVQERGDAVPFAPSFLSRLEDKDSEAKATIAVEKTQGPILLISVGDDQQWPSETMADRVEQRLEDAGFPHHWEHHRYPGAGHAAPMSPPYLPKLPDPIHPVNGIFMALGGTAAADAAASIDSWSRTLVFLENHLRS